MATTFAEARDEIPAHIPSGRRLPPSRVKAGLDATVGGIEGGQQALFADKAPKASPNFTDEPTAPTASPGTNTTQIATTAFATDAIATLGATIAPLASPAFTGVPTAPTPAFGGDPNQIATTAFFDLAASSAGINSSLGGIAETVSGATSRLAGEEGMALDFVSRTAAISDFADVLSATGRPRDLLTVTRATAATHRGRSMLMETASANTLAYQHEAVTGSPLGVMIGSGSTNLVLYSQDFDNAAWTKTALLAFGSGSVADSGVAPDGTTTADLIVPNTNNTSHDIRYDGGMAISAASAVTVSAFVKPSGYQFVRLYAETNGGASMAHVFFLADGGVGFGSSPTTGGATTAASGRIVDWLNGWLRVSVTGTFNAGTAITSFRIEVLDNVGNTTFAGDGTSGVLVWGAQVEQRSAASAYIPTTSGTAARNADVVSIPLSAVPWSSTQGTLVVRGVTSPVLAANQIAIQIDDGTINNRFRIERTTANSLRAIVFVGGVQQALLALGTYALETPICIAFAWSANDFAASINGGAVVTASSGALPTVTTFRVATQQTGILQWDSTIASVAYINRRLPNTQLVSLSTL